MIPITSKFLTGVRLSTDGSLVFLACTMALVCALLYVPHALFCHDLLANKARPPQKADVLLRIVYYRCLVLVGLGTLSPVVGAWFHLPVPLFVSVARKLVRVML